MNLKSPFVKWSRGCPFRDLVQDIFYYLANFLYLLAFLNPQTPGHLSLNYLPSRNDKPYSSLNLCLHGPNIHSCEWNSLLMAHNDFESGFSHHFFTLQFQCPMFPWIIQEWLFLPLENLVQKLIKKIDGNRRKHEDRQWSSLPLIPVVQKGKLASVLTANSANSKMLSSKFGGLAP